MHLHSFHSGKTRHVTALEPMDSYSTPERIYRVARTRGMDLVTITDHDSIDGCLAFLDRHPDSPDFFISEEVSLAVPGWAYPLHIGVYGMAERDHAEIQVRRQDPDELLAYLRARGLFHAWNHPFFQFPIGPGASGLLAGLLARFAAFEGVNAAVAEELNTAFREGLSRHRNGAGPVVWTAGSDAHSLARVGSAWTEAPGDTPDQFLAALARGDGRIGGSQSGGQALGLLGDALGVYLGYFRDLAWRNEVHQDWSVVKKIRNGLGWAAWLPVFTVGAALVAGWQFRAFRRRAGEYRALWDLLSPQ